MRPGRLDRHVAVDAPDQDARREIFEIHTRDKPVADSVAREELAAETEGYVGADVEVVCREATQIAVREYVHAARGDDSADVGDITITEAHFEQALEEVDASVGGDGSAGAAEAVGVEAE